MSILTLIAERRIDEAAARGELDDLANKGRPIPREDLSGVPEELRMGYKILKNANVLPEELQLNREILSLQDLIDGCIDPGESKRLKRKLTEKRLRYNILMERNSGNPLYRRYEDRIMSKLGI